jgi:hypothetical protein
LNLSAASEWKKEGIHAVTEVTTAKTKTNIQHEATKARRKSKDFDKQRIFGFVFCLDFTKNLADLSGFVSSCWTLLLSVGVSGL